mgnify:CR=1 FL=1|tara:strand:- start:52645 stop:53265 length:621 start_codon:yes stop_codon:yes gene_type:complete
MQYTRKITDQQTGEVFEIKLGEHLTFTEAANKLKIRRSSLIRLLLNLGICQKEYDAVAKDYRHRLKPEAKERGLGYRILGKHGPFDVLSPAALDWVTDELAVQSRTTDIKPETRTAIQAMISYEQKIREKLDLEGKVRWLMDHFPKLPVADISKGLGISRALAHRYQTRRDSQLAFRHKKRGARLDHKLIWPIDDQINEMLQAFQS